LNTSLRTIITTIITMTVAILRAAGYPDNGTWDVGKMTKQRVQFHIWTK